MSVLGMWSVLSASHPTRVRGLKFIRYNPKIELDNVAPYTGAWIEITGASVMLPSFGVAPYTGAWIEINGGLVTVGSEICRTLHGCVD